MLYEIDKTFHELLDRIDADRYWMVTFSCRLATGYVIELHNIKTGKDEEKFTTTFGEMEYFVNELLRKKIA